MMCNSSKDLKQKTISGMIWNSVQKFGCSVLSFISNIILARILIPADFGCIGMLTIFIAVSESFVDGGFGSALIQKKIVTQKDLSTIFVWNLVVAVLFYVIIFFTAPYIAEFYHIQSLNLYMRVLGLIIILNGLSVIQATILTKELDFKRLSTIYLIGTLAGVILSIVFAILGFGVWSLIIKAITTSTIVLILIWSKTSWRPNLAFYLSSFKTLFNFGSLMFLSKFLTTIFDNLQSLVIGRIYSATDLGYFTQARKLDEIPSTSISQIVTQVSFPVFSKIADDLQALQNALRKNIVCINFIILPLQFLLILLGEKIIIILFSAKWLESTIYFRILCIYAMFVGLNSLNSNIFKAIGKSNIYLIVQFIKQLVGIIFLIIGLEWGIIGVAFSISVSGFIWWVISASVNSRIVNYGFFSQFKDIFPSFIISSISALIVYESVLKLHVSPFLIIILGGILFLTIYLILSKFFNNEPYGVFKEIIISLKR